MEKMGRGLVQEREKQESYGASKRALRPVVIKKAEASPTRDGEFLPSSCWLTFGNACASPLENSGCHGPHSASPTGLKSLFEVPLTIPGLFLGRDGGHGLWGPTPPMLTSVTDKTFRAPRRERTGHLPRKGHLVRSRFSTTTRGDAEVIPSKHQNKRTPRPMVLGAGNQLLRTVMKEDIMKETEAETVTQTPLRGLQQRKMESDLQKVA